MIPKEMLLPSRLLATPDKLTLKQLGGAYANCGIGRNFIFKNKEGNFVSRSQVRYLYDDDNQRYCQAVDNDSPPCDLLNFFDETKEVKYCILGNIVDKNSGKPTVINEMGFVGEGGSIDRETVALEGDEFQDLCNVTTEHRTPMPYRILHTRA